MSNLRVIEGALAAENEKNVLLIGSIPIYWCLTPPRLPICRCTLLET